MHVFKINMLCSSILSISLLAFFLQNCGMPKEQGYFGERSARSTSKNAKDKHNSVTLRGSQGGTYREQSGMGDISNHMLCCDSEKDSGYSGKKKSLWKFTSRIVYRLPYITVICLIFTKK